MIAYNRSKATELEVPIIRIDRNLPSGLISTLLRYLIQNLVSVSAKEKRTITRITDQYLIPEMGEALSDNGFSCSNGTWTKINFAGVMSIDELLPKLRSLASVSPEVDKQIKSTIAVINSAIPTKSSEILLKAEQALWPVKIIEVAIPTFIVPIWPEWAMHLFDVGIGAQDLFGGNPNLIFRVENAYYRNSKPGILSAPGRVLWYVSKHTGKYHGTESIRACSYLEEIAIDKPKALFTRFRRLGVYTWPDVFKLARGNPDKKIMGFTFTKTEVLTQPIERHQLQKTWREQVGKNFHIQSPMKIPEPLFFDLYSKGL
jgi:hypothetical protein